jgi:hypothetical protein
MVEVLGVTWPVWLTTLQRALFPPGRPMLLELTEIEDESSFDFIFDQVVEQLRIQDRLWDAVDGRLRLILGVIGIILAAMLQGLTRGLEPPHQPLAFITGASAGLAVGLFLVAGATVAWAYRPREFDWPPKPQGLADFYRDKTRLETRAAVLGTMLAAYDANARVIRQKVRAFKAGFVLSAAAVGLLGVAIVSDIALHTAPP